MKIRTITAATTLAAIAGGAGLAKLQKYYWQKFLPDRLLAKMKQKTARRGQLTGSWIAMTPDAALRGDKLMAAYRGGVTFKDKTGNQRAVSFQIAADGQLLDLSEVEKRALS